jgi:hypothetical protein
MRRDAHHLTRRTDVPRLCTTVSTAGSYCMQPSQTQYCPTYVPAVNKTAAAQCDSGCVKTTGACVPLASVTTGSVSQVCFTDGGQHGCSTNNECSFTGTCNMPSGACLTNATCVSAAPVSDRTRARARHARDRAHCCTAPSIARASAPSSAARRRRAPAAARRAMASAATATAASDALSARAAQTRCAMAR